MSEPDEGRVQVDPTNVREIEDLLKAEYARRGGAGQPARTEAHAGVAEATASIPDVEITVSATGRGVIAGPKSIKSAAATAKRKEPTTVRRTLARKLRDVDHLTHKEIGYEVARAEGRVRIDPDTDEEGTWGYSTTTVRTWLSPPKA